MRRLTAVFALCAALASVSAAAGIDTDGAVGWATCSSVFSGGDYDLTGGGDGPLIVIRNDGTDMRAAISDAVRNHDVIVFDGSCGDFVMPTWVGFQSLTGKTLIGVNGARFRTEYVVTPEIHELLDALDVKSLSQHAEDNLGGTLSNGIKVAEQCELTVRQALIDYYGDQTEPYRNSGVFIFNGCSNIIVRNIDFVGPGAIDLGAADLITLNACDHIWIDHCRFTDGMDGNVDIINNSDFITVSDTHFRYTDRTYIHPLSNLNSGIELTDGSPQKNNISWFRCFWDEGCLGRMPLADLGIHHILNCYWDCKGGTAVDANKKARVLIEGGYFTNRVGRALAVRDEYIKYEWRNSIWNGKTAPVSNAKIEVPYSYTVGNLADVPLMAKKSGPTLAGPYSRELSAAPAAVDLGMVYAGNPVSARFNISAFGTDVPASVTLTAPDGLLLSPDPEGEYTSTLVIEAVDCNLIQSDVYFKAHFAASGVTELSIEAATPSEKFVIPVKADVVGLKGDAMEATLSWPFSDTMDAATSAPEAFSGLDCRMGEKIYRHSVKTIDGMDFTFFNPTEAIGKAVDEECRLDFDIETAPGYVFIPKTLRFNVSRIATDMCYIRVTASRGSGNPLTLLSDFQPARSSNNPAYTEIELPLNNIGVGDTLHVSLYLYNMYANKQLALGDFRIEGDVYQSSGPTNPGASGLCAVGCPVAAEPVYYDLTGRRILHPQAGRIYVKSPDSRVAVYQER